MGFLTILTFWTSTAYSELFETNETIAMVKAMISKGMFILIPAMMIAGGSGMSLGRKRVDAKVVAKKKRMPFIAANGLLILVPAAFYLESKASSGAFDTRFYLVQGVELIAGAANLVMAGRVDRQKQRMTSKPDNFSIKEREAGPLIAQNLFLFTDTTQPQA